MVFGFFVIKEALQRSDRHFILVVVTTVQEIEAAIPRLSRAEVEELRTWIDDFLEDRMELTDQVKAALDQSRREIAAGDYTTRRPK